MSSLPPSSTPPEGDESARVSLPAADAAPEASPVAAATADSTPTDTVAAPDAAPAEVATIADAPVETTSEAPVEVTADAAMPPAGGAPRAAQEDCGPQLKKLFPALFSNPPKPLKLRIQADIQARAPGLFTKPQLSAFLRRYTGSHAYLNALLKATHRFDLDGNPGDELSDEHRNAAGEELARRRANTQARVALENEQRANRATLLKEYEANTLPAAEFAASKGVPENELQPLIARARKEALEPPVPAFNRDRRGPQHNRGPRPDGQRNARPPRDANAPRAEGNAPRAEGNAAQAEGNALRPEGNAAQGEGNAAKADGAAPQADAPRAPRPPRGDGPRGPRTDRPHGPRGDRPPGPRGDAPRADGPRGPLDAPRADRPRGPLDSPRRARPDAPGNGPRPDSRGPRADGPRGPNNGPRSDAPRGPRRDDDRRPPRQDDRGPRPTVVSSPAAPTAMALAFSALNALKTKK